MLGVVLIVYPKAPYVVLIHLCSFSCRTAPSLPLAANALHKKPNHPVTIPSAHTQILEPRSIAVHLASLSYTLAAAQLVLEHTLS